MNSIFKHIFLITTFCITYANTYSDETKVKQNVKSYKNFTNEQMQVLLNYDQPGNPHCIASETSTGNCVVQLSACREWEPATKQKQSETQQSMKSLTTEVVRNIAFQYFVAQKIDDFQIDTTDDIKREIENEKRGYVENELSRYAAKKHKVYEENYASFFAPKNVERIIMIASTDSLKIQSICTMLANQDKSKSKTNSIDLVFDTLLIDELPKSIKSYIELDSLSSNVFKLFTTELGFVLVKSAGMVRIPKIEFDENNRMINLLTFKDMITEDEINAFYTFNKESFCNPDTILYEIQIIPDKHLNEKGTQMATNWKDIQPIVLNKFQLPITVASYIKYELSISKDTVIEFNKIILGRWRVKKTGLKKGNGYIKFADIKDTILNYHIMDLLRMRIERTSAPFIQNVTTDLFWQKYCEKLHVRTSDLSAAIQSGELDTTYLSSSESSMYLDQRFRKLLAKKEFEKWFCSLLFSSKLEANPCKN